MIYYNKYKNSMYNYSGYYKNVNTYKRLCVLRDL